MAGYKDFQNGNILDETDLDGYLMQQVVMRFPTTSDRDTALAAVVADGMMAHTDTGPNSSTDVLWHRRAGVWVPISSAEVAYTPTWRSGAGGTTVGIGNGTISGSWRYAGGMVAAEVEIERGTTTSVGTTYYAFGLPVAPASILKVHGPALVLQTTAHRSRQVHGFSGSEVVMTDDTGNSVGATPNGSLTAWASGNRLGFSVVYKPA